MRFRPNPGLIQELEHEPDFAKARLGAAKEIRKYARLMAPHRTGAYRDSLEVLEDGTVYTADPFGHLIEFGSANNEIYSPLRRGTRAAGYRFVGEPKPHAG